MEDEPFSYPKKGDDIFKKIVGFHNACLSPFCGLGPTGDNFPKYIAGYKEAADILIKNIINERLNADYLVLSIIFLYRHYIELLLKSMIQAGYQLLSNEYNDKKYQHHKIAELWKDCRKVIEKKYPDTDKEKLDVVGNIIDQMSIIDPGSIDSRYPTQRDGSLTMEDLKENQLYINLQNLQEIMDSIYNFLNHNCDAIYIELIEKRSIESEYSSY